MSISSPVTEGQAIPQAAQGVPSAPHLHLGARALRLALCSAFSWQAGRAASWVHSVPAQSRSLKSFGAFLACGIDQAPQNVVAQTLLPGAPSTTALRACGCLPII